MEIKRSCKSCGAMTAFSGSSVSRRDWRCAACRSAEYKAWRSSNPEYLARERARGLVKYTPQKPRFATLRDKLDHYSIPEPNSGCVLWLGKVNEAGYGWVRWKGLSGFAHRLSWMEVNGPITSGLFACHKCDVPACINPDHLFLGTHQDNMDDMVAKRRARGAVG